MKKFVIVAFSGLFLINGYAQEEGICSRTLQVQNRIIYQVEYHRTGHYSFSDEPSIPCEEVNEEDLLDIEILGRSHTDEKLTTLKPEDLEGLSNLRGLRWANNDLTEFPPGLERLTKLEWLDLSNNKLEGNIPESLGELASLIWINLQGNQLTGTIPESLAKLDLERFILGRNELSGNIPEFLGNFRNLKILKLDSNQFYGSIPESLGNAGSLMRLDLQNNELSGEIPASFGNLVNLEELHLDDNQLTGNVPESFERLGKLTYLYLDNNPFTREVPEGLGNLENLAGLILPNRYPPESRGPNCTELNMDEGNIEELHGFRFNKNALVDALEDSFNSLYSDAPYVFNRPLEQVRYYDPVEVRTREQLDNPTFQVLLNGQYGNQTIRVSCLFKMYASFLGFSGCERYSSDDNENPQGILVAGGITEGSDGSWATYRPGGKSFRRLHTETCTTIDTTPRTAI